MGTTSVRQDSRHDPITRKNRAAHLQRTANGRFSKQASKTNKSSKAKGVVGGKEDTEDEEDPLSLMDDSPSKPANTNALAEFDGNATRTAYCGPTASEMLKALEDSLADAMENGVHEQENTGRNIEEPQPMSPDDMNPALQTVYQGPTASEMRKTLEESVADADLGIDGQEKVRVEESDMTGNNALEKLQPTQSCSRESSPDPTTSIPPSPSQRKRILTYPNGPKCRR